MAKPLLDEALPFLALSEKSRGGLPRPPRALGQSPTGFIHSPTRREPAVAYSSAYLDLYDLWSGRQLRTGILLANRPFSRYDTHNRPT